MLGKSAVCNTTMTLGTQRPRQIHTHTVQLVAEHSTMCGSLQHDKWSGRMHHVSKAMRRERAEKKRKVAREAVVTHVGVVSCILLDFGGILGTSRREGWLPLMLPVGSCCDGRHGGCQIGSQQLMWWRHAFQTRSALSSPWPEGLSCGHHGLGRQRGWAC